jgi:signal transduction histidine kinase
MLSRSPGSPVPELAGEVREAPRLRRLRKLTQVSRGLANATTLHQVLSLTVAEAALLLDASRAALLLYDDDGQLQVRATHAVAEPLIPPGETAGPPSLEALFTAALGEDFERDAVAVPLIVSGKVRGAIAVIRAERDIPEDEEEWLLSALADQAMVALEKARLEELQGAAEQRAIMARVGHRLLGHHDLPGLFAEISSSIRDALRVDMVGIFGRRSDGTFERVGGVGWTLPTAGASPKETGRMSWEQRAFERKNPIAFGALDADEAATSEAFAAEPAITSGLVVAIEPAERHGVIGAYTLSPRDFSREEHDMLASLSALLSSALEREAAERKARIAAEMRNDLLAIVSHDLRAPLSAITMAASMLSEAVRLRDDAKSLVRFSGVIERNGLRMAGMLGDLLDFEGLRGGGLAVHPAAHGAAPVVDEIAEMFRSAASAKSVGLESKCADGATGWFDRDRTLQVLSNLVGNAIKFTPAGGTISVHAELLADAIRFVVRDTGPGIPLDHLPHVFERYWQAKRTDRRGIGLGLAIAKGLVEAQGGSVSVESVPGEGATFSFTLPREPA